jgi:hypothetical protein
MPQQFYSTKLRIQLHPNKRKCGGFLCGRSIAILCTVEIEKENFAITKQLEKMETFF